MDSQQKEIIEAVRADGLFDYLANEGHNLGKGDLLRLAKELAYGIHAIGDLYPMVREKVLQTVGNELVDWWGED